jgi:hypothetical protein
MREYSHSLSAFDKRWFRESNIIFRFFFQSDDATNEEGVIIDNFVVGERAVLSTTENEFKVFLFILTLQLALSISQV